MHIRTLLTSIVILGGCANQSVVRAQQERARLDSAQIIRTVWSAASEGHLRMRAAVLWLPSAVDTGQSVSVSPALHQLLLQDGIPLERRRKVGDDTVVFMVTKWTRDSSGVVLELRSAWTTVLRNASRACRAGAGNIEGFRVHLADHTWVATRHGPVLHGAQECTTIPPA